MEKAAFFLTFIIIVLAGFVAPWTGAWHNLWALVFLVVAIIGGMPAALILLCGLLLEILAGGQFGVVILPLAILMGLWDSFNHYLGISDSIRHADWLKSFILIFILSAISLCVFGLIYLALQVSLFRQELSWQTLLAWAEHAPWAIAIMLAVLTLTYQFIFRDHGQRISGFN